MDRRTALKRIVKGGFVVAATSHVVAAAPELPTITADPISAAQKRREEDAFIIGAYMILTPANRALARNKLKELGEHELADAFERMAS